MKLYPIFNNIVVRRDDAATKSSGGIILPEQAKDKPRKGTVLAAGPGKYQDGIFVETSVKEGDKVLFGAYSGSEIDLDGQKVVIMPEQEIIAIIK
jgi:chaperonin GroES